jgi:hypothetical protein
MNLHLSFGSFVISAGGLMRETQIKLKPPIGDVLVPGPFT